MSLHTDMTAIRTAALAAVDPAAAVTRALRDGLGPLQGRHRLLVIAVGKAAVPMGEAALQALGPAVERAIIITKRGQAPRRRPTSSTALFACGHPVPDEAGLQAAARVEAALREGKEDGVLLLLSGGASALLPAPAPPLVLSDVVGDRLDVIGSGPAVPDPTTYADAWAVLEAADLVERVPEAVRAHLQRGRRGELTETPKPGDPIFRRVEHRIVGSNRLAAQAAVAQARNLGYRALLLTTFVEGEAREVAKVAAALVKGARKYGDPLPPPLCLVWGGETTVTVRGKGLGGRNQELALAAALALEGCPHFLLMALATDGTDGPTDAAGGLIDGETAARIRAAGFDPRALLADNDAYHALRAAGALLRTGPTGTNVNDLLVALVGRVEER